MKWILGILNKIYVKTINLISNLWNHGIADVFVNKRYLKLILDISIIALWFYMILNYYHGTYMAIAGIALIMSVFGRIFTIESDYMFSDLLQPFISIATYAFCALLYWYVLEFSLVMGVLILPYMTNEMINNYQSYYHDMTPEV